MPWCPKCKNEYRAGMKVCADCGCELVNEEPVVEKPLIFGDEEQMRRLQEFLEYNHLANITLKKDETESFWELYVTETDRQKALTLLKVFLQQEAMQEEADGEDQDGEEAAGKESASDAADRFVYRDSTERARENQSSGWALLMIGGVGLVAVILCFMGVLPLHLGNSYMFYGVMTAVFVLFVILGVISMKNARIFAQKAETENSLRDAMLEWCQGNLNAEEIDHLAGITADTNPADGTIYFRRVEQIREKINHQFLNLDQTFLEHFIDEQIYDMVFGENRK